jgi:hypothetical protein
MDRISLQYAPNANETSERLTRTIRKTHDTRNERTIHEKKTHYTRTNERNETLFKDKRSWFYRGTI